MNNTDRDLPLSLARGQKTAQLSNNRNHPKRMAHQHMAQPNHLASQCPIKNVRRQKGLCMLLDQWEAHEHDTFKCCTPHKTASAKQAAQRDARTACLPGIVDTNCVDALLELRLSFSLFLALCGHCRLVVCSGEKLAECT